MKKLYYGDNLEVLRRYIKDDSIDLCYIDPPFNSKRNYNQIYNNIGSDDKAQAQAFIDTWTWDDEAVKGFEQITTNYNGVFTKQSIELIIGLEKVLGKSDLLAYLISMTLRIAEIFRVLKPTGSFYLHCDPTASHYLKLVLDSIFCAKGGDFINEIVWRYKRWSNAARNYQRMHDVILFYSKTDKYVFNVQYQEYSKPEAIEKTVRGIIDGKLVRLKDEQGKYIERTKPNIGVPCHDVFEIQHLQPTAKERLGYPTQKPETLLERIIKVSSNEGDLIADFYCGCGTTISVAERLNRNWIGIDITYQSISLILKRLEDSFGKNVLNDIEINGIPEDFESAVALAHKKDDKTRKEFEKWAVLTYSNNRAMINEKKGADAGIDGIAYMLDRNENNDIENRQVLFSVKSDKTPHVSYISQFYGTIEREKAAIGYFITLFPPTSVMIAECKKIGKYKNNLMEQEYPKIEIVTVEEILNGKKITIPTSHQIAVVKSAQLKETDKGQAKLFE
ncbi:MAG: site-specific DNA-methyltransferase [Bacteroidales bacterium]|nr:site-specific DNA-methyltransferase [Bacteroidales bacterium]